MARKTKSYEDFISMITGSTRGCEIALFMEQWRDLFPLHDEWIQACLTKLPKTEQEALFVSYMIGSFVGAKSSAQSLGAN